MKNKSFVWFLCLVAIAFTGLTVISCNKKFDEPPTFIEPNITPNTSISDLKALHTLGAFEPITTDKIIAGIVVADDRSGNFYKSIVIQDATGGITVRLDGTSLFTTYPVGRKLYFKLKGLYLGDYNGLVQIGGGVDDTDPTRPSLAPLASNLFDTYIEKGSTGNTVTPKVVSISDLTTNMLDPLQSTLIQLDNFEFLPADTNKTYAPPQLTVNFTVRNCAGKSIVMRNSGYATFAGLNLPNGNGSVVAIYSIFGSTPQLFIRDTADVQFNGARCNGSGTNLTIKSIQEIRALTAGSAIPAATGITGIIVSDTKNESAGNYRIQDSTGYGIQLRFTQSGNGNFSLGSKLKVDVSGLTVGPFNGDLQVNNVTGAEVIGTGTVTPRVATVADIATNKDTWASTVVTVNNVSIAGGSAGTTGTNYTVTDATGSIVSFVRATVGFTPPTSASTFTGYVSLFNGTPQLTLRTAADVVAGGTPPPPPGSALDLTTSPLTIDFNNISTGLPTGVSVYTAATATTLGAAGAFNTANEVWAHVNSGFKNFASANGLTATSDSATQVTATDRALGVRQTSASDKGVAFVFQIANTTGKSNLKLDFQLQSLDASSPRATKWTVDYGTGDNPAAFTPATATGTVTTGGSTFSNNPVTVDFGSALNNSAGKVWVRIVVLDATTGAGNRTSSAIDDVKFSWN